MLQDVFSYEYANDAHAEGATGELRWTGIRPAFTERFPRFGVPDPLIAYR